jgi:surfeit locus 1 family protein
VYRFALRPLWLLSHLFAAGLVVLFVALGFWQLRRHDEQAERNATIEARMALPERPVGDLVDDGNDPEELAYRSASASGRYVAGADVRIDNRSNDGLPGVWLVTPLRLEDGSVLAVSRGFLGSSGGEVDAPPPPDGTVRVEGTLTPWIGRGCGVRRDDDGTPLGAACLRRDAVEEALGEEVLPVVLQRTGSSPGDSAALVPVPLPERDAGPHRSYAVQWFIFATIGAVGYPLVLRRVSRDRASGSVPDRDPPIGPAGH